MFIMEATIPGCSIRNLFKQLWIILQVYIITIGWDKNEPWTNYPSKKWYAMVTFLFHSYCFSTERMGYRLDSLTKISNEAWNIFRKRSMHFIHSNINSLLSRTGKINYIVKLANASVILLNAKLNLTARFWAANLK